MTEIEHDVEYHLDATIFQKRLGQLAEVLARKVKREPPKLLSTPKFVAVDLHVLIRQAKTKDSQLTLVAIDTNDEPTLPLGFEMVGLLAAPVGTHEVKVYDTKTDDAYQMGYLFQHMIQLDWVGLVQARREEVLAERAAERREREAKRRAELEEDARVKKEKLEWEASLVKPVRRSLRRTKKSYIRCRRHTPSNTVAGSRLPVPHPISRISSKIQRTLALRSLKGSQPSERSLGRAPTHISSVNAMSGNTRRYRSRSVCRLCSG